MATSGQHAFNITIDTVIQEAYERLGVSSKAGYDLVTARRSLNFLMIKWMNDGVNLFTLDMVTLAMTQDQDYVNFNAHTYSEVLSATVRDTNVTPITDIEMERLGMIDYLQIPTKSTSGKPVQYTVERNAQFDASGQANHKIYIWPVPDQTYYSVRAWMIKYPQDVGWATDANGQSTSPYIDYVNQQVQIPKRFIPAMISGLTVELANKLPGVVDIQRRQELTQIYEKEWANTREEDRERASFIVQPSVPYIM